MLRIEPLGDGALSVVLGEHIGQDVSARVARLFDLLSKAPPEGLLELTPTYCALCVQYDVQRTSGARLSEHILALEGQLAGAGAQLSGPVVDIPVLYGGVQGPDLAFVAQNAGMSEQEVIAAHALPLYPVYMLGFTPGFPYLGGMDERLSAPRLETPRVRIPAGSVGIAGAQTGIYSVASPGGWRIIGRTPLALFDPARAEPFLLSAGDRVRFVPIDREQYLALKGDDEPC